MFTEIVPQLYLTWQHEHIESYYSLGYGCLVGLDNSVLSIYFASATYWSTQQQQQHTSLSMHEKKEKITQLNKKEGQKQLFTRCSAIAERPRCRVRYSFRQK